MRRAACGLLAIVCTALFFTSPGVAHHSRAMFDRESVYKMEGTVTIFDWTNPHTWLHVRMDGGQGEQAGQEWALEGASTGQQMRLGWTSDILKPGDHVTVEFNPLRDGTRGGIIIDVILADGTVLSHGGMPNNPGGN